MEGSLKEWAQMATRTEKAFCALTESVTIVERGFHRKCHRNPSQANSVRFVEFCLHFTAISAVTLLVTTAGITSLFRMLQFFLLLLPFV